MSEKKRKKRAAKRRPLQLRNKLGQFKKKVIARKRAVKKHAPKRKKVAAKKARRPIAVRRAKAQKKQAKRPQAKRPQAKRPQAKRPQAKRPQAKRPQAKRPVPVRRKTPSRKTPTRRKMPTKRASSPTRQRFAITINGVRLTHSQGVHARMSFAELVGFTHIPLDRAVVRINGGDRHKGRASLHHNDSVRITRLVKKRKPVTPVRKERPVLPTEQPHKETEHIWLNGEKKEVVWVDAFPEEWLRRDGSVAIEASYVRAMPEAGEWEYYLHWMDRMYGRDSEQFRKYVESIAQYTERPVREVYTLFFSG